MHDTQRHGTNEHEVIEEDTIYFYHPIFGPWRIDGTEEEVAEAVSKMKNLKKIIIFYGPPGIQFSTKPHGAHLEVSR